MAIEKVLIVDDEQILRDFLSETLLRKNLEVQTASNGEEALKLLKNTSFDLIFTDMKMGKMTGIELLKAAKEISPKTLVVVVTAYGSIENAVEAMRLGAFNYLIKPFTPDIIETVVEKANEHSQIMEENAYLRKQISGADNDGNRIVIAKNPKMQEILDDIKRIAKSNANVFITGSSGTGKEVIASEIHFNSLRSDKPFIKVNCAALPETLIESELFGHEKGAFTGAHQKRLGRFELANGGTLLLDEITEVPIFLQAKLLRAIQEQEFERVGGTKPIKVDVRIVSASNRNIKQAIEDKLLREDLFYRLNVVPIDLPSLQKRPEDIIPLATFFIKKYCAESHITPKTLSKKSEEKLLNYSWPGNVRELANIIERAVVMEAGTEITPASIYIEPDLKQTPKTVMEKRNIQLPIGMTLKEIEKKLIIETLHAQNNNRTKTAKILDISVRTLRNKLKEYHAD